MIHALVFLAVAVGGYVQADGVVKAQDSEDELDPSTGAPLNQERFLVRRARLRSVVERGDLRGSFDLDGSTVEGSRVRLVQAEVAWRWAFGEVAGGLMKIPFGVEVPSHTEERFFLEETRTARALFPGDFDAGVRASVRWRFLVADLAVMNGAPAGELAQTGGDPNSDKDLVGRAGIDLELAPGVRLAAGLSGLTGTGFHAGDVATKDTLTWRDANEDGLVQLTELQVIPGRTATPSEGFTRFGVGGDVRVVATLPRLGELAVFVEAVIAEDLDRGLLVADPVELGRSRRELGWQAGATLELGPWAQAGLRVDRYDPDRDAHDQQGAALVPTDASVTTIAGAVGIRRGLDRLTLEYDHEQNAFGRSLAGVPETRAADRVTLRAQVSF